MAARRFEFWIDRGGTFTDCLRYDHQSGELRSTKVLSSDRAPLEGIRQLLELAPGDPIPPCDIRMGTTVATNALLERKGSPCALVTTTGFADVLEIGTQTRPDLFSLQIVKPQTLYAAVRELEARADPEGCIARRPTPEATRQVLTELLDLGFRSLAVVFLHAYRCHDLEVSVGATARELGFEHIALSHEVADELGMVSRGDTATLDAYLTPLIRAYVRTLLAELPGSTLRIMQSSGGLTGADRFRGPHAILSGPAGGVIGCGHVARLVRERRAIGFDMGGTSTDVSRWDEGPERTYESEVAGVRVRAPMLSITTVAAGGGSICRFDGRRFTVGPDSAGAHPGPLCYGHPEAQELTVTDLNLLLGRLQDDRFPFPLDVSRVRSAVNEVAAALASGDSEPSIESIAEGFLEVANSNMAEAIRRVSVARGYDVREHALVVFGGAGGQHGAAIARRLGIRRLVFHPLAGVLSALGMGLADVTWHGETDAGRVPLTEDALSALSPLLDDLERRGRRTLTAEGLPDGAIRTLRRLDLRYAGTETALTLDYRSSVEELREDFTQLHARHFGYARPGHTVELVAGRIEVAGERDLRLSSAPDPATSATLTSQRTARVWLGGGWQDSVPVFRREELPLGSQLCGPALVLDATGTVVVEPGFELQVHDSGILVMDRVTDASPDLAEAARLAPRQSDPDPVRLEIMAHLFMSIAEQMGHVLRRTALSTNIRERLDFSCAVFDARGDLVANAPHIPVHLGAMSESVRAVIEAHPHLDPGDVFATNDPEQGGSHLPDVTVVSPVHDAKGKLLFFVASRGHHADIGGITPGSMPAFSSTLAEEGVVLRAERIVARGAMNRDLLLGLLASGPHPARDPAANIADIEAQVAANRTGHRLLDELVANHGPDTVQAYMNHVQNDAAERVADAISALPDGHHQFRDAMDDGTPVAVTLRVRHATLDIDFTGTGPEVVGNLNAPRAVTLAAVIYFLRVLVGSPIPLNSGCLRHVRLHIPEHSLLAPRRGRAVAGGNVETSQRVVDVLLAAVGLAAASQGTMNNLAFGNDSFGYYETIGGGAGAGPHFNGVSGVHTHMTNTRITDPEVLESRFPVLLRQFAIRTGSGGHGAFRGGDGLVRELEATEPLRASLLTDRRVRPPFGLHGGEPGAPGRNFLNGTLLPGKCVVELLPGDTLRIETPGGGGYGRTPTGEPISTGAATSSSDLPSDG